MAPIVIIALAVSGASSVLAIVAIVYAVKNPTW
jgi:hypothetical protein